jgi:multicomponent Na+:H+ antiporter subunit E
MKNFAVIFLILLSVWVMLNNTFQTEVLVTGIIIALVISAIACRRCELFRDLKLTPKSFFYTVVYFIIFFFELIKSNIDVTLRVLNPSLPINPGIVEVKTVLKSKYARMVLANSITLTPGTLTVEIADDSLFIHWIDVESEDIQSASEKIVSNFEKYLKEIFG